MSELKQRFGRLLAAHRRQIGLTQDALAERAGMSVDMISKLEGGATGASFRAIDKLSAALGIDPAELFTSELSAGALERREIARLSSRMASLTQADQAWIVGIVEAALKRPYRK